MQHLCVMKFTIFSVNLNYSSEHLTCRNLVWSCSTSPHLYIAQIYLKSMEQKSEYV